MRATDKKHVQGSYKPGKSPLAEDMDMDSIRLSAAVSSIIAGRFIISRVNINSCMP